MLELNSHDGPSIIYEGNDKKSFNIFTLASDGDRHYRIIKDKFDGIYNYDFKINFKNHTNGIPLIFDIPYLSSNFIKSTRDPEEILPDSNREFLEEGIYKLIHVSKFENKEIPAEITLNTIYNIGQRKIKILYFRIVNNEIIFSGYFGNKFYNEEPLPNIEIKKDKDFDIILFDKIYYYFVKIQTTPNMVIVSGKRNNEPQTEIYFRDNYEYNLSLNSNGILGINFIILLRVKNKQTGEFRKNISSFFAESSGDVEIKSVHLLPNNFYEIQIQNIEKKKELNIRLFTA